MVKKFRCCFELLSTPIGKILDDILLRTFLNELKDVQVGVKLFGLSNLVEAMERAQSVKDKNWIIEN